MEHFVLAKSSKGESVQETVEPERGSETHKALLNDFVLQNIFKYLGYKDLKSCRGVKNRQWLRNSKKAWWAQTKVIFEESRGIPCKITEYLEQTEITSNATNYKFDLFDDECETHLRFFERIGPSIKYLEISSGEFHSVEGFRRFMFSQCPNLEKLVLNRFYLRKNTTTDNVEHLKPQKPELGEQTNLKCLKIFGYFLPVSWMELLSHFPNLQDIEATGGNPKLFQAISMIRQRDPKKLKLKHIKISRLLAGDYDDPFRSILLDPNLSFETIHISVDDCKPETVVDILELHAPSLKELHIFGVGSLHSELKLPRKPLDLLEKLRISSCHFPVEIFKYTPTLKTVKLTSINITKNNSTPDSSLKVKTCKHLTVFASNQWEDTPNSDFEFLLNIFPNVEIFETRDINNLRFSLICERMTRLKSFKVRHKSEVDDTGLLGYDPSSNSNNGIHNPNITNLKDLQTISMFSKTEWAENGSSMMSTEMSNGSAILKELEELPQLNRFELHNYKLQGDDQTWGEILSKYSGK